MDPGTAIGVASSVLTFAQCAYDFIKLMKEVHDSSSSQRELQNREEWIKNIQTLACNAAFRKSELSSNERAVNAVAKDCHKIAGELVSTIKSIEPKVGTDGKYSWYESFKGAAKQMMKKGKLDKWEAELQACIDSLLRQHIFVDSYENRKMLEQFKSEGVRLDQMTMDQLSGIIRQSEQQLEGANKHAIFEALNFKSMDRRFQAITIAAASTYKWIFDEKEAVDPSLISRCAVPLKTWLSDEGGIFHISGKPGSGKSTLMKFLYQHVETTNLLQRWAGSKKLVLARVFIWKPGSDLQKNSEGMYRSLLSQILEQAHDLVTTLFPHHWNPNRYHWLEVPPKMSYQRDEFQPALQRLLAAKDVLDKYRFCFFIDGLDEFEDVHDTQIDFARHLKQSVEVSDGALKICASSREYPEQMNNLHPAHRIKLQDLTATDIRRFVIDKLDQERKHNEDYFHLLEAESVRACGLLSNKIVERAEGVFLWVSLTMKMLCEELSNHESLAGLFASIERCPSDLQKFFSHILQSIKPDSRIRKEAYFMLAFVLNIEEAGFGHVCLGRFNFIRDVAINPANPHYPEKAEVERRSRLEIAEAWISARCRGLLEVKRKNDDPRSSHEVTYIHRSVSEYLSEEVRVEGSKYLSTFDFALTLIWTLLAYVELGPFISYESFACSIIYDGCGLMGILSEKMLHSELIFKALESFHAASVQRAAYLSSSVNSKRLGQPIDLLASHFELGSFLRWSIDFRYYDYLVWHLEKNLMIPIHDRYPRLLQSMLSSLSEAHEDRHFPVVSKIVKLFSRYGIHYDPRYAIEDDEPSSWDEILIGKCAQGRNYCRHFWKQIQTYLEAGASLPMWSRPTTFHQNNSSVLRFTNGDRSCILIEGGKEPLIWAKQYVPPCLWQEGGVATLRDFLDNEEIPPSNAREIKAILEERSNSTKEGTIMELQDPARTCGVEEVSTNNISTVKTETPQVNEDITTDRPKTEEKDITTESQEEIGDALKKKEEDGNAQVGTYHFLMGIKEVIKSPLLPWFLLALISTSFVVQKLWPAEERV